MNRSFLTSGFWLWAFGFAAAQQPQGPPTFRAQADVVAVDVQVVDKNGEPIATLGPADFSVWLNGKPRRVASASLVRFSSSSPASDWSATPAATLHPSSGGGRMIVIAIDELSFDAGGWLAQRAALDRFISRLRPDDLAGVLVFPFSLQQKLELTINRAPLRIALDRVVGAFSPPFEKYYVGPSEIVDIASRDGVSLSQVAARECGRVPSQECIREVQEQVMTMVHYYEGAAAHSLGSLRTLLHGLAGIQGPKTLVVVSRRLMSSERAGGRIDLKQYIAAVAGDVAAADARLYVVHPDDSFESAFGAASNKPTPGPSGRAANQQADEQTLARGLQQLAGESGGSYLQVNAGTPDHAFDRILRETTAHYLVAVDTEPSDRNGETHFVKVSVNAKGADVHHRMRVVIPKGR